MKSNHKQTEFDNFHYCDMELHASIHIAVKVLKNFT
jgi:hypothetical protein